MNISVGGGLMANDDQNNDDIKIDILMSSLQSEAEFISMIKSIQENKILEV